MDVLHRLSIMSKKLSKISLASMIRMKKALSTRPPMHIGNLALKEVEKRLRGYLAARKQDPPAGVDHICVNQLEVS